MKIGYVVDKIIICGGIIVAFEHCKHLRDKGYDAFVIADWGSMPDYDVPVYPINKLHDFTDEDIIVAVWYPQIPFLENFKGRKIQFSQDCMEDITLMDPNAVRDIRIARHTPGWEMMAVSEYAGRWTGCDYTVIPNGINERFYKKLHLERDIDVLIEGVDDINKGIKDAFDIVRSIPRLKIAWLARETRNGDWLSFNNPPQKDIPAIYQRSKVLIKCSGSEGFGLPHLEGMASGCLLLTYDSGGNDFCIDDYNCYKGDKWYLRTRLKDICQNGIPQNIINNAYKTANKYKWEDSIDKLIKFLKI